MTQPRRQSGVGIWFWASWGIALFLIIMNLAPLVEGPAGLGWRFFLLPLFIPAAVSVTGLLVTMVVGWRDHTAAWRSSHLGALFAVIGLTVFSFLGPPQDWLIDTGFRLQVERAASLKELRGWAVHTLAALPPDGPNRLDRHDRSLPTFVRKLDPKEILVLRDPEGRRAYIQLFFGGGFYGWSLWLGDPRPTETSRYFSRVFHRWIDGVYSSYDD